MTNEKHTTYPNLNTRTNHAYNNLVYPSEDLPAKSTYLTVRNTVIASIALIIALTIVAMGIIVLVNYLDHQNIFGMREMLRRPDTSTVLMLIVLFLLLVITVMTAVILMKPSDSQKPKLPV